MMHGFYIKEVKNHETDVSAKEKTENERARLQKENEHKEWQKCSEEKKSKGQKKIKCLILRCC